MRLAYPSPTGRAVLTGHTPSWGQSAARTAADWPPSGGVERPRRKERFARLIHTARPRSWRTFGPRRLRRQSQPALVATECVAGSLRPYGSALADGMPSLRNRHQVSEQVDPPVVAAKGPSGELELALPNFVKPFFSQILLEGPFVTAGKAWICPNIRSARAFPKTSRTAWLAIPGPGTRAGSSIQSHRTSHPHETTQKRRPRQRGRLHRPGRPSAASTFPRRPTPATSHAPARWPPSAGDHPARPSSAGRSAAAPGVRHPPRSSSPASSQPR
jgi:hypothetical protein